MIDALRTAVVGIVGMASATPPTAYACRFADTTIRYQLCFGVVQFTSLANIQSAVIIPVTNALQSRGIPFGIPPLDVRVVP